MNFTVTYAYHACTRFHEYFRTKTLDAKTCRSLIKQTRSLFKEII